MMAGEVRRVARTDLAEGGSLLELRRRVPELDLVPYLMNSPTKAQRVGVAYRCAGYTTATYVNVVGRGSGSGVPLRDLPLYEGVEELGCVWSIPLGIRWQ